MEAAEGAAPPEVDLAASVNYGSPAAGEASSRTVGQGVRPRELPSSKETDMSLESKEAISETRTDGEVGESDVNKVHTQVGKKVPEVCTLLTPLSLSHRSRY